MLERIAVHRARQHNPDSQDPNHESGRGDPAPFAIKLLILTAVDLCVLAGQAQWGNGRWADLPGKFLFSFVGTVFVAAIWQALETASRDRD